MRQVVRFCTTSDGVRIGYAKTGTGPPLVKAANYLTHLEHGRKSPVWRHWLRELSRNNTFICYDTRGCGLSDRNVDNYNMDAWVCDLEAVVADAGLERFPLLGISQGASVSIAYAARHPKKVSHLILYGGYARGRFMRSISPAQRAEAETLINVIRLGWGRKNPAFRQLFTTLLMPEGTEEQMHSLNELARISATPENAAAMERAFYHIEVAAAARRTTVPTLVLHARQDACIPFEEGRLLATMIPGARFVPLDSRNHILLENEPAWRRFLSEVRAFLGSGEEDSGAADLPEAFSRLTSRESEVLELVAQGLSNDEIAGRLFISSKTVRNHITRIFNKLHVDTRAKAIVLAREAGVGTGNSQ